MNFTIQWYKTKLKELRATIKSEKYYQTRYLATKEREVKLKERIKELEALALLREIEHNRHVRMLKELIKSYEREQ
jgi:hypothetical protein